MDADQRILRRHAAVVAAVLYLLFAGRLDGHEVYPTAGGDMVAQLTEPLTVNPAAQQYVPQPEVMPVPTLITNPGAAAATGGACSPPNEPAPSTVDGEGYGTATTTPESPSTEVAAATDQAETQPSPASDEAAPATDQSGTTQPSPASDEAAPATDQTGTTEPSASSYGATPATGQTDAAGEPTNGLSPKAIANIIKEHNVFRAKEHVPPLKWNATVAGYAQQYAEERKGDCALEHSTGPYGENLMYGQGKAWSWKQTVDEWSDEKKSYHYGSNTCDAGKMCGHYTAVVWKDTTDVGCGRVTCASGDTLMVCSYWPPGNYDGEKPY